MFFSRETWRTPTSVGAGYVGFGTLSAGSMCVLGLGCCDSGRVVFSSEIFSAGKSYVPWGSCRVLCRDGCRVADSLRLVEALPVSERLGHTPVEAMPFFKRFGHTVLAMLANLAATFHKVSEMVLLAWGGCENIRLLAVSELALRAWGMQKGKGEVPRVVCLNETVPDGSSRPSHGLPPLRPPPPGIPRLPGELNWAPRCSPEKWTAWCRVRDGLDVSNDYFEVVQIEQEEEVFDLAGIAEGWDQTELMYFVFKFGTKKGMQYCLEYYEMKNSARQVVPQGVEQEEEEVFDLVGVAEAEGWDQTELMFFVFEYGTEKGVQFCREYYEMKNSQQEVRLAVCPEPTKEAKVRFLFRESGRLGVQVVDGGLTLEEWLAGWEGENSGVGVDGYFTTLGGKMLNPGVEISRLGLGGLQEVVFHGRLKGGACKGAGRVDSPMVGEWQCSFCMAPHCWHTKMACYKCGTPTVLRIWSSGARGSRRVGC